MDKNTTKTKQKAAITRNYITHLKREFIGAKKIKVKLIGKCRFWEVFGKFSACEFFVGKSNNVEIWQHFCIHAFAMNLYFDQKHDLNSYFVKLDKN
jgi:hypothetical protein